MVVTKWIIACETMQLFKNKRKETRRRSSSSSEFATNLKIIQGGNCQQNFTMVWSTVLLELLGKSGKEEARGSANDKTTKENNKPGYDPIKPASPSNFCVYFLIAVDIITFYSLFYVGFQPGF